MHWEHNQQSWQAHSLNANAANKHQAQLQTAVEQTAHMSAAHHYLLVLYTVQVAGQKQLTAHAS
jgi:hypothetical protein